MADTQRSNGLEHYSDRGKAVSASRAPALRAVHAESVHHCHQDLVLMFEVVQDDLDLLLVLDVDL